jgi:hypothetical protein
MDDQVLLDLPRLVAVDGHRLPAPFYLTREMFGGIPIELATAELTSLAGDAVADLHVHTTPEVYVLISPTPGGAECLIEIAGNRRVVRSPASCYIPAGKPHRFAVLRAEHGSWMLGILLAFESGASRQST